MRSDTLNWNEVREVFDKLAIKITDDLSVIEEAYDDASTRQATRDDWDVNIANPAAKEKANHLLSLYRCLVEHLDLQKDVVFDQYCRLLDSALSGRKSLRSDELDSEASLVAYSLAIDEEFASKLLLEYISSRGISVTKPAPAPPVQPEPPRPQPPKPSFRTPAPPPARGEHSSTFVQNVITFFRAMGASMETTGQTLVGTTQAVAAGIQIAVFFARMFGALLLLILGFAFCGHACGACG
ncbi:MAG: hypothetical protein AAF550_01815 [Myxococcota bacterium]